MTDRFPFSVLQARLWSRLETALAPVRVWDAVPQDAAYPHVLLGDFRLEGDRSKTANHPRVIGTLQVMSSTLGFKEAEDLADTIVKALTRETPLDLSPNFYAADCQLSGSESAKFATGGVGEGLVRGLILSFTWQLKQIQ